MSTPHSVQQQSASHARAKLDAAIELRKVRLVDCPMNAGQSGLDLAAQDELPNVSDDLRVLAVAFNDNPHGVIACTIAVAAV